MQGVLVTGGAGFIGSALCRYLVTEVGAEVTNIDKLTYAGNTESLRSIATSPLYSFFQADICDASAINDIFEKVQPGVVIHLAAESHVDRSITGSRAFLETNVLGTFEMLEASRRYWSALPMGDRERFRFLHVSTDEVFGSLGPESRFTENSPYQPSSPYSATKAASDHLARAWYRTYGLPVIVSNCSNNYGPFQFPEKLIPLMIVNALEGKPLPIYGNGANVRDWLYVDDHVRALHRIVSDGRVGETYNVGGSTERTNLEVIETICGAMDVLKPSGSPHERLVQFVPDRPGHDQRYAIDATKLETELGWRARETFETGIVATIRWFLENEWWWRPLRDGIYDGERLGLAPTAAPPGRRGSGVLSHLRSQWLERP